MHQTRNEVTTKLPIKRKGTKYVARAASHHRDSVPLVIALRDMLMLAKTAKEVKEMIKEKLLKINGKITYDPNQSIKLFNLLQADKLYQLTLSPTGKFIFEPASEKEARLCKVINKRLVSKGVFQLHMNDGTNVITKEPISVGDSVFVGLDGKIKRHISFAKGKKALVISGKYAGMQATIESIEGTKANIALSNGGAALLDSKSVVVL